MASYLDDKTRLAHYDACRAKKKRYERVLDVCMWIAILFGAFTVIPELFVNGLLNGIFIGDISVFFLALFKTLGIAAAIYAIYLRKWPITIVAALVVSPCNSIVALATAAAAVSHWLLHRLSQEEGWPLFEIPYAEQEQRQKNIETIIRNRAVTLGARVSTEPSEDTEMHDILDESKDTVYVKPKGYHDRFRDSTPQGSVSAFTPEVMDSLEEMEER